MQIIGLGKLNGGRCYCEKSYSDMIFHNRSKISPERRQPASRASFLATYAGRITRLPRTCLPLPEGLGTLLIDFVLVVLRTECRPRA